MNISASTQITHNVTGLAGRLVTEGLLSPEQAQEANREASKMKVSLVRFLTESMDIDSHELAELAAHEFGVPLVDLAAIDRSSLPEKLVPASLMAKHHAVPLFRRGNRLFIGVSDPTNLAALDEIKFATGISTDAVLVEERTLGRVLDEILEEQDSLGADMEGLGADGEYDLEINEEQDGEAEEEDTSSVDDAPIVRFINKVLLDAIKQGASDIHFEPYEKDYRVRFRTDGMLREVVKPPRNLSPRLSARLKVM